MQLITIMLTMFFAGNVPTMGSSNFQHGHQWRVGIKSYLLNNIALSKIYDHLLALLIFLTLIFCLVV
jgi:hypothetical protein